MLLDAHLHPSAPDDLEDAITRLKLRGLKMVPTGWYPYVDAVRRDHYDLSIQTPAEIEALSTMAGKAIE